MREVARSGSVLAGLALGVVIAVGAGWAMADQVGCGVLLGQAQQMLEHQHPKQARVMIRSALAKCASLQPAGHQLRSTESVSRGRKGISQGYCPGPELGRLS